MAAIARIDYGLAEGEFWRLTPRQFALYGKRYEEVQKRNLRPFQFLATITARCAGNEDADFMRDEPTAIPGAFEAVLEARAKRDGVYIDGESTANPDNDSGAKGTDSPDEAGGSGA